MRIDTKPGEGEKWERLVSDEILDAVAVKELLAKSRACCSDPLVTESWH